MTEAKRLTIPMMRVLTNLVEGSYIGSGFRGAAQFGGLNNTIAALHRRGFMKNYKITPAGRKVLKEATGG